MHRETTLVYNKHHRGFIWDFQIMPKPCWCRQVTSNKHLHTYTYFFFTPRSEQKKKRTNDQCIWICDPSNHGAQGDKVCSVLYLQSGWPAMSPDLLQWFWQQVTQLLCLLLWRESPCFLQCCPRCSGVLWWASASRLIHQTLRRGDIRQTTRITNLIITKLAAHTHTQREGWDHDCTLRGTIQLSQLKYAAVQCMKSQQ